MTSLAELFPDADYRFHVTLRRAEVADYFRSQDASGRLLAERRRWLNENPARYAALVPEGEPLLAEFVERLREAGEVSAEVTAGANPGAASESMRRWGETLEPDLLLLSPDEAGAFRLRGGALCFPTGWALEEKLGKAMEEIHGVVPGLNPAIGAQIAQFLARLRPGAAYLRDNWGLAATDELNLHPALARPRLLSPFDPAQVWLRVEHQALVALPRTRGVAFGIRIALHPLNAVLQEPSARRGLRRALATMPELLARYKGLAEARSELIALLGPE